MNFATLFDKNYLSRGIILYNSLKQNCVDFKLYVLALDNFTSDFLEKEGYLEIELIKLKDLEDYDSELKESKKNRSLIEYYFTISPCLPLYILNNFKIDHVCTLDADLLFFSSPQKVFDKLENHSVIITPHKFSKSLIHLNSYGLFNVSFQIFKNNSVAINCLKIWRLDCLKACADIIVSGDNFADQKYLDKWPNLLNEELFILNDNVCGIAPWNVSNYDLKYINNILFSNNDRVIFYHFHDFKIFNKYFITDNLTAFGYKKNNLYNLYKDYYKKNMLLFKKYNLFINDSSRFIKVESTAKKIFEYKYVYFIVQSYILKINLKIPSLFFKK